MYKRVLIISMLLSFCLGQINLTKKQADGLTKKLNAQVAEIEKLKTSIKTLKADHLQAIKSFEDKEGSEIQEVEDEGQDMVGKLQSTINKYVSEISKLDQDSTKIANKKIALQSEKENFEGIKADLEKMIKAWNDKLAVLSDAQAGMGYYNTAMKTQLDIVLKSDALDEIEKAREDEKKAKEDAKNNKEDALKFKKEANEQKVKVDALKIKLTAEKEKNKAAAKKAKADKAKEEVTKDEKADSNTGADGP